MSSSNSPKSAEKLTTEEKLKLVNDSLSKFNEEMVPLDKRLFQLKKDIEKATLEKSKLMEKLIKEKDKEREKLEKEKKKEVDRLERVRVEKERELEKELEKKKSELEKKKLENKKLERECGDLELDKYIAEERLKSKSAKIAKVDELEKSLKKTEAELEVKSTQLQQHKEAIRSIAMVSTMSTNPDSSIYLFNLGTTEELKSIFKIPNEKISEKICIYKFGLTNDINRRETEHSQKFNRKGCKNFKRAFVKPSSIIVNRDNENKLFDYFKKNDYTFISEEINSKDKYRELVCIGETEFRKVVNFYKKELE